MIFLEKGKTYTLSVDFINETSDGRKYIYFKEQINGKQLRVKALDFLAQPDTELPASIDVVVKDINRMSELPVLYFSKNWLIDTLYCGEQFPKKFSFNIEKVCHNGLSLKDSYGVIHFFPFYQTTSDTEYSVGEQITLFVDEISTHPQTDIKFLKLRKPESGNQINQYIRAFSTRVVANDDSTHIQKKPTSSSYSYGIETDTVEFKQSLVYHPKVKGEREQGAQIYNIMRSISGFMNHEGGTLYIGVKDDGSVHGIHNDFDCLNEENGFSYSKNWDGWSRKIVDSVRQYLGLYAAGLIKIEKEDHGHMTVGKISIRRSSKPIYVNNAQLYCRQCNETAQLKGDALTMFILERLRGNALGEFIDNKFGYDTDIPDVETDVDNTLAESDDDRKIDHKAIDDERNQNNWMYIRLFDDGKYILTPRDKKPEKYSKGNKVTSFQLQQFHKHENQVLLMIYNTASKVNTIDFDEKTNDWYHIDRDKIIQALDSKAPWVQDKSVSIKCVDRNDLLVAFYSINDKEYCYVRDVSDIKPSHSERSKALFTGGHKMIPNGASIKGKIMHIPGSYRNWIAPIVNKKDLEINDTRKCRTIQRLIDILNDLYPDSEHI